jgi:hypothetical protein
MKNKYFWISILLLSFSFAFGTAKAQNKNLKLVFIRHAERPDDGENLTCKGFNRSILLPGVLYKKFGVAGNIYVPSLNLGGKTKRVRMFETIIPYAIKYNLSINSEYEESDYKGLANALLKEKSTVIIVWEHNNILPIINYFGITKLAGWADDDFDNIWIVIFKNGKAILAKDKEGLAPSGNCTF